MIGPDGALAPAWTGDAPRFFPSAATVYGNTLYSAGRLRYHGGTRFLGVTEVPVGSDRGTVVGCFPTSLLPDKEWSTVSAVAADESHVYVILGPGTVLVSEHAIARFPRP